jgi:hypothetical protein
VSFRHDVRFKGGAIDAVLLRLRCNVIASVAAKHFDGRFGPDPWELAQLLHPSMAILAFAGVVNTLRHGFDGAYETRSEWLTMASVGLRSKSQARNSHQLRRPLRDGQPKPPSCCENASNFDPATTK